MTEEIVYMLGIVAVGFAVNYTLRALPFLLFAGRGRGLPRWVEPLGRIISPIIISGLIIYSFSTLKIGESAAATSALATPWPYLAGVLTVVLQIWKRNPLASIVAGTLLYMILLSCGCTTQRTLEFDARDPSFRYTTHGVCIGERPVSIQEVVETLEDCGIPHDRVIYVRLESDVRDLRGARLLMAVLAQNGYTRTVLVTERRSEAVSVGRRKKPSDAARRQDAQPKKIRYKKALDE